VAILESYTELEHLRCWAIEIAGRQGGDWQ